MPVLASHSRAPAAAAGEDGVVVAAERHGIEQFPSPGMADGPAVPRARLCRGCGAVCPSGPNATLLTISPWTRGVPMGVPGPGVPQPRGLVVVAGQEGAAVELNATGIDLFPVHQGRADGRAGPGIAGRAALSLLPVRRMQPSGLNATAMTIFPMNTRAERSTASVRVPAALGGPVRWCRVGAKRRGIGPFSPCTKGVPMGVPVRASHSRAVAADRHGLCRRN